MPAPLAKGSGWGQVGAADTSQTLRKTMNKIPQRAAGQAGWGTAASTAAAIVVFDS